MQRSEQINELAAALTKAQGAIEGAKKDSINPHFRSAYADLASVWEAVRKPLADNGLAVCQWPRTAEGGVEVETVLMHVSGQFMSDVLRLPVAKMDAQAVGSATSYSRRYALMAVLGVAAIEDDGNAATEAQRHEATPARIALARERTLSDPQKQALAKENVTVGRKMSAGSQAANSVEVAARRAAYEAIASFADMDIEALRLWWRDSSDLRESWESMYPELHQKVLDALDNRRDALKVHNG